MPDETSFDAFYRASRRRLFDTLYALTGNPAEAQDVVHEAYMRAWQRWSRVGNYADPEAWVRMVARRIAANRWRRTRNRLVAHRRAGEPPPLPGPNPDRPMLVAALAKLPVAQRTAIVLHHLLGLPVTEVAIETGAPEGTVKARLSRGRRALAELLEAAAPARLRRPRLPSRRTPMSDPFDTIFDTVRSERLPGPFQPAEVIRRRAQQRTRRQAVSAGAAVLVVAGLGAGGLAAVAGPSGSPVPAPAASPPLVTTPATPTPSPAAPATIPPRWLLTSEDLGPGPWDPPASDDDPEWLEKGWSWACDAEADWGGVDQYLSIGHRHDQVTATWYETDREVNSLWSVAEVIELYETGWGTANVEDVRAALERCAQRPTPGMETAPQFYTVIDEGFAGDESVLIEAETYTFEGATISPDPWYSYVAVVRVGDVVRTISYEPWQRAPVPEAHDYVRELAQHAADRH